MVRLSFLTKREQVLRPPTERDGELSTLKLILNFREPAFPLGGQTEQV
jgi:hypothetical protein